MVKEEALTVLCFAAFTTACTSYILPIRADAEPDSNIDSSSTDHFNPPDAQISDAVQERSDWTPSLDTCGESYIALRLRTPDGRIIEQCLADMRAGPSSEFISHFIGCTGHTECRFVGADMTVYRSTPSTTSIVRAEIGTGTDERCVFRVGNCPMWTRLTLDGSLYPDVPQCGSQDCQATLPHPRRCAFQITRSGRFGNAIEGHLVESCENLSFTPTNPSSDPAQNVVVEAMEFRSTLAIPVPINMCNEEDRGFTCTTPQ